MKKNVLNKSFGCQNMTDSIRSVIVKHPENAYISQSDIDEQAPKLNYFGTPKFDSPANALIMQCVWASLLTFSGTFHQLITYIIFASWIFYAMSAGAVIILRKNKPNMKRPYKTPLYPLIPIVFIIFAIIITINTILEAPRDAIIGLIIILSGVPLYYYWKK